MFSNFVPMAKNSFGQRGAMSQCPLPKYATPLHYPRCMCYFNLSPVIPRWFSTHQSTHLRPAYTSPSEIDITLIHSITHCSLITRRYFNIPGHSPSMDEIPHCFNFPDHFIRWRQIIMATWSAIKGWTIVDKWSLTAVSFRLGQAGRPGYHSIQLTRCCPSASWFSETPNTWGKSDLNVAIACCPPAWGSRPAGEVFGQRRSPISGPVYPLLGNYILIISHG